MPKFKPGDLVMLKSGSPPMVVESVSEFQGVTYNCSWFAGAKHNNTHFSEEALKPADNNDS